VPLQRLPYVRPFDYAGFPVDQIRPALLHMRDLGQALYDLRHLIDTLPDGRREAVLAILDERTDFADDYVEIGFGHLEDEAGFLRHLHVLGDLTPAQQQRVDAFRSEFETRMAALRSEAAALQDQWQRARREYYRG
jgi:ABC-type phosphate transport system auxiliary subunit